jgi:RNA polymerase sigma factor (sigma-70 family)
MEPRRCPIDVFSGFLRFENDRCCGWRREAALVRNMRQQLTAVPADEADNLRFWVMFWYEGWHAASRPLAERHLWAYLQEPCYWAAYRFVSSYTGSGYGLEECFQMAAFLTPRVLRGFDPRQGNYLERYAARVYSSGIRETLRERHEVHICTDWALLRATSRTRLNDALRLQGLAERTIAQYTLAYICFGLVYVPRHSGTSRQLQRPNAEEWAQILQLFNDQAIGHGIEKLSDPGTLEQWLLTCTRAIRTYLNPPSTSINDPGGSDEEPLAFLSSGANAPLEQLIAEYEEQERHERLLQIQQVLLRALTQFDGRQHDILRLYYGEGKNQQQIARAFNIDQSTISRRLQQARTHLLQALGKWSATAHRSLDLDLLKSMSEAIDDWLRQHFRP